MYTSLDHGDLLHIVLYLSLLHNVIIILLWCYLVGKQTTAATLTQVSQLEQGLAQEELPAVSLPWPRLEPRPHRFVSFPPLEYYQAMDPLTWVLLLARDYCCSMETFSKEDPVCLDCLHRSSCANIESECPGSPLEIS